MSGWSELTELKLLNSWVAVGLDHGSAESGEGVDTFICGCVVAIRYAVAVDKSGFADIPEILMRRDDTGTIIAISDKKLGI